MFWVANSSCLTLSWLFNQHSISETLGLQVLSSQFTAPILCSIVTDDCGMTGKRRQLHSLIHSIATPKTIWRCSCLARSFTNCHGSCLSRNRFVYMCKEKLVVACMCINWMCTNLMQTFHYFCNAFIELEVLIVSRNFNCSNKYYIQKNTNYRCTVLVVSTMDESHTWERMYFLQQNWVLWTWQWSIGSCKAR